MTGTAGWKADKAHRLEADKDHRLEACATEILAGAEYFDCGPLKARISARACLLNQGKARGLSAFSKQFYVKESCCLICSLGKEMRAYPPGVVLVPGAANAPLPRTSFAGGEGVAEGVRAGTPAPLTPAPLTPAPLGTPVSMMPELPGPAPLTPELPEKPAPLSRKKKRPPAWLKNATPAVRRDYWKEKGLE